MADDMYDAFLRAAKAGGADSYDAAMIAADPELVALGYDPERVARAERYCTQAVISECTRLLRETGSSALPPDVKERISTRVQAIVKGEADG